MKPWITTLIGTLALAGGCAAPVASTGSQHVRPIEHASVQGPVVPAGTRFSVRLEQSLDTMESSRGERFTAVVQSPLIGSDGQVIVPTGARVYGHVHSLAGATGPRVRLRFEGIQTTHGDAPLQARISSSTNVRYPGPAQIVSSPYYYSGWYGYRMPYGGGPVGGYVWQDGYDVYVPREVHLPAGGVMDLTLTRAIVPPGTTVTPLQ